MTGVASRGARLYGDRREAPVRDAPPPCDKNEDKRGRRSCGNPFRWLVVIATNGPPRRPCGRCTGPRSRRWQAATTPCPVPLQWRQNKEVDDDDDWGSSAASAFRRSPRAVPPRPTRSGSHSGVGYADRHYTTLRVRCHRAPSSPTNGHDEAKRPVRASKRPCPHTP